MAVNNVGLYFDETGEIVRIVHADNDDFRPFDQAWKEWQRITVDRASYEAVKPRNLDGRSVAYDLRKAILPSIKDVTLAALVQAKLDAVDARDAEIAAQKAADIQAAKLRYTTETGKVFTQAGFDAWANGTDVKR